MKSRAICGEIYQPSRHDSRYCSRKCALESELAARRAKYAADPAYRAERYMLARAWKVSNPDKVKKNRDLHPPTAETKARLKVLNAARYQRNKAQMYAVSAAYYRRTRAAYPWRICLGSAKHRAKRAGLPFNLTKEWAASRWTGQCEATGLPFVLGNGYPSLFSPSIDRLDSTKGYTTDNCWFVLWSVNSWKTNGKWGDIVMISHAIAARFPLTDLARRRARDG